MSMSMIPLLLHSDSISPAARDALREVIKAPHADRTAKRVAAAHVLFHEFEAVGLDCGEIKDLVGLPRHTEKKLTQST